MVRELLKRVAARLPHAAQHELRRWFFRRQIRGSRFATDEQEYKLLDRYLSPGDWALDIGANVGHYAMRISELVGVRGRVVAFEPVPETFSLLSANACLFAHANVSLINAAASDRTSAVGVAIPCFSAGFLNYYQAHLTEQTDALNVLTIAIDSLALPRIALAKIDVEGHELRVLHGMRDLLSRDRPVLIVETGSQETLQLLRDYGYTVDRLPGSSNVLCTSGDKEPRTRDRNSTVSREGEQR